MHAVQLHTDRQLGGGGGYQSCGGGGALGSTLYNCTLTGNSVGMDGGGALSCTLYNCVLTGNGARHGGGALGSTLYNCLLTGNSSVHEGGGAQGCTLYNCTLTGNWSGPGQGGGGAAYGALYNCIMYPDGALSLTLYTCWTADPKFVGNGDYSLQSISPCIDAAHIATATSGDIRGVRRGHHPDIGAYERTNISDVENRDLILEQYPLPSVFGVRVAGAVPRQQSNLIDIDYLYTNSLLVAAEIRGFAYLATNLPGFNYASGIYPIHTLAEGTATNYGVGIMPSATPRRLTWDAGADVGRSIQDIKILLWACETNTLPLSQHFVTIPASGTNVAMTISRYVGNADDLALNRALLFAVWRGWATNSGPSLYAVAGTYNGQLLFVNSSTPTDTGKLWMCEKLGNGIRLATAAEIKRAQEATTPGTVAQRPSYWWSGMKVNQYGIETGVSNAWYFVKE